jgi:DNA modification methylase
MEQLPFLQHFSGPPNPDWAFSAHTSTNHLTHGYHRYPAKFIPHLVKKLIEEYTTEDDQIVDIFAGCGTTLVESKVHGRESIGVDINPVARLITQAKITPIEPEVLEKATAGLSKKTISFESDKIYYKTKHPRIDYWFRENEKNRIAFLFKVISRVRRPGLKTFYLCALSNILKPCSRWLQSGTKPQIDPLRDENIADPFEKFFAQVKQMTKKNKELYDKLVEGNFLTVDCKILEADAKSTGLVDNSVGAIITSPPYVTSYEYADIHQLTGYWFEYITEISEFRKTFIGTFYSENIDYTVDSPIAQDLITRLEPRTKKYAREIAKYFNDMIAVSAEMFRILKPGGIACVVMGNTTLKDIEITSAQAFAEMMFNSGFEISDVIKRQIPNKLNPTIRDKSSGKFTTRAAVNSKEVYPEEYIIIAKKPHVS